MHILLFSVPPPPEDECGASEPKANGLTAIFNEYSETFPTFECLGTFLESLSDDEEVVQVMSLLMTDDFNNLLNKIGDIDEWVEVRKIKEVCIESALKIQKILSHFWIIYRDLLSCQTRF